MTVCPICRYSKPLEGRGGVCPSCDSDLSALIALGRLSDAHHDAALAKARKGDLAGALAEGYAGLAGGEGTASHHLLLAQIHLARGERSAGRHHLDRAAEMDPENHLLREVRAAELKRRRTLAAGVMAAAGLVVVLAAAGILGGAGIRRHEAASRVLTALAAAGPAAAPAVAVTVEKGVITLRGAVEDEARRGLVESVAQAAARPVEVDTSGLTILPEDSARRLARILRADPGLRTATLTAAARAGGVVRVSGEVDAQETLTRVKALASSLLGEDRLDISELGIASPAGGPAASSHTVREGETLSHISLRLWGSILGWDALFESNRDVLTDPNRLSIGMRLRIPPAPARRSAVGRDGPAPRRLP
jgi:nucleoid-associated protein YgaU